MQFLTQQFRSGADQLGASRLQQSKCKVPKPPQHFDIAFNGKPAPANRGRKAFMPLAAIVSPKSKAPYTPDYQPWKVGPYKMTMGLEPLDKQDWIEIDSFYEEDMAFREELVKEKRSTVIATLDYPEAHAANEELLELLADFLPERFPDYFKRSGNIISNLATGMSFNISASSGMCALEVSARLVQEDLCLMTKIDGELIFTSAAVLFPQRWSIHEKLGKGLDDIHKPVPMYKKEISLPVSGFMDRLKVDKPFWRANWAITDNGALFQPVVEEDIYAAIKGEKFADKGFCDESITIDNAGDKLFVRCERETLSRLPKTGAILFTIRTYNKPIGVFESRPEVAGKLAKAYRCLPDELVKYKTMLAFKDVAIGYLDKVASTGGN